MNQKFETNDEELARVNQDYRQAQERTREAETKICELKKRITELEGVLSQVRGPMESVWIPSGVMKDLRELAIKYKESVNDYAVEIIWYSMADKWAKQMEEK
ncbi:MAG: hypothetical protein WBZ36_24515 [Candidatus Nitrosopolaris sp.]